MQLVRDCLPKVTRITAIAINTGVKFISLSFIDCFLAALSIFILRFYKRTICECLHVSTKACWTGFKRPVGQALKSLFEACWINRFSYEKR